MARTSLASPIGVVLLLSMPSLAQVESIGAADEATFVARIDTTIGNRSGFGEGEQAVGGASLITLRFRAGEQTGFGFIVPFGFGVKCFRQCMDSPQQAYADLGNLALFATWQHRLGPDTRLPLGLALAVPSAFGSTEGGGVDARAVLTAPTRGFEDLEFFTPGRFALVPQAGLSHDVGRVGLSASVKVPLQFPPLQLQGVGAAQVMVRLLEQPRARVSGGVRALGVVRAQAARPDTDAKFLLPRSAEKAFSVAVEPRVEARLGALELRAGLLLPMAWSEGDHAAGIQTLLDAWSVRLGVGSHF